jgi:hypothetical protein
LIERLLVLKLDAVDCAAEACLNGVPIARADAARPSVVVPVHEYTVAGANRLELVIWPRPVAPPQGDPPAATSLTASGKQAAQVRMLLPRLGNAIDEASARTLAQVEWAPAAGLAYEAPLTLRVDVTLQVNFPRWRWLEAPVAVPTPAMQQLALGLIQQMARDLSAGNIETFVSATRLRTEELAVAYQRDAADEAARLRAYLSEQLAGARLTWVPMEPEGFCLRSIADGRLLECLDLTGMPMLRSVANASGRSLALPLRLAAVEGRLYVLR